jgi:DNA-binding transcriptional LysR family regulator
MLDEIAVFANVARAENFTVAAKRLGMSVSSVSRRLSALEDRLGMRLVERTTRKVRLTADGTRLLEGCLGPVEALENLFGADSRRSRRVVRVTAPPLAARRSVGPGLLRFMQENPEISVELTTTNTMLSFIQDNIDIAFRLGPLPESEAIARKLWSVPYVVLASEKFLAERGLEPEVDRATFEELPGVVYGNPWRFVGHPDYMPPVIAHSIDDLELAAAAVQAGLGVSCLPATLMLPGVCELSVAGMTPVLRDMHAVYPSRRLMPDPVRALIDYMATTGGQ